MKIVLQSTGTPFGLSRDLDYFSCERRAWLDEQHKATLPDGYIETLPPEGLDAKGKKKPLANTVGTAVHELLRLWRTGKPVPPSGWEFYWHDQPMEYSHSATCAEARRIYHAYEMDRSPDEFGETVATELQLKAPLELFGVEKTGAVDLVARIGEAEMERLATAFGLILPEPGIYLIDDKTADRDEKQKTVDKFQMRAQFKLYNALYDIQYGELLGEAKGSIANVIFKTAEVKYKPIFVPPPSGDDMKMVAHVVSYAESQRALGRSGVLPMARPGPDDAPCRSWGRICNHFVAGRCKRY